MYHYTFCAEHGKAKRIVVVNAPSLCYARYGLAGADFYGWPITWIRQGEIESK